MDTKTADEKIRESFEAWFAVQGLGAHQHDTLLEAWLRGALAALEIDREDMSRLRIFEGRVA